MNYAHCRGLIVPVAEITPSFVTLMNPGQVKVLVRKPMTAPDFMVAQIATPITTESGYLTEISMSYGPITAQYGD